MTMKDNNSRRNQIHSEDSEEKKKKRNSYGSNPRDINFELVFNMKL